ncbi:hypothetical protein SJ05684_b52650 (plasmid) [Sinorhizobium sojae CCBAU 05684]|uniref:Uncharacterized protein n=1 Tax=Sinorhizobium sojae CCBAU 05684 TaxID=716928 RepID=A0A249PKH7_9HYPH|nr:hypothetical protein SJ05684_b52650 [Sinorhizobium sojae CCBAU 05684]
MVDGDLTIVSVPDTGRSANSSVSGGVSLSHALSSTPSVSGVQIGGGKGYGWNDYVSQLPKRTTPY